MYPKSTRPSAKRDDRIARPRRAQTCDLRAKRVMRMCPRSGQIFSFGMRLILAESLNEILQTKTILCYG